MQRSYTPTAAAALVGISVSTLRNYCSQFKGLLSPEAAPPAGQERRLSDQDIAVLQRVKEMRAQGMDTANIVATLQGEDAGALQPYIDSTTTDLQAPPSPTEPAPPPAQAVELYSAIVAHTTALQARLDAMQQQIDSQARQGASRVTLVALGFLAGLTIALIIIGVLWLGR